MNHASPLASESISVPFRVSHSSSETLTKSPSTTIRRFGSCVAVIVQDVPRGDLRDKAMPKRGQTVGALRGLLLSALTHAAVELDEHRDLAAENTLRWAAAQ